MRGVVGVDSLLAAIRADSPLRGNQDGQEEDARQETPAGGLAVKIACCHRHIVSGLPISIVL